MNCELTILSIKQGYPYAVIEYDIHHILKIIFTIFSIEI
jgi:hypothetical protein